ncbi:MAG: 50S ribosomal protein L13 [Xanthomonadaceae bacterium]|nr:50S ribosomal protein L13 [Xanthomonadaceae bacterium]
MKQIGPHYFEPKGPNAPKWFIVDAKDQVVGRLASMIAKVLVGKHKPSFTRHADTGDFVVVVNAEKVVFTRNKWKQKIYRDYSGYISGLKEKTAEQLLARHPEQILERAVQGMLNKTNLARHQLKKLKVYAGEKHPHAAQDPQTLPLSATRRSALTAKKGKKV